MAQKIKAFCQSHGASEPSYFAWQREGRIVRVAIYLLELAQQVDSFLISLVSKKIRAQRIIAAPSRQRIAYAKIWVAPLKSSGRGNKEIEARANFSEFEKKLIRELAARYDKGEKLN